MSDYSNLKFKQVDDLPLKLGRYPTLPLSPDNIFATLPFLKDMKVGDIFEFEIPKDVFGYSVNENRALTKKYDSMRNALARTFKVLEHNKLGSYMYRIHEDNVYIKRLG